MEIGFVSFDQEALNRANKVMQLLQGQGAVDELGLGRIRDAFSNMMFPGMSTLQTRAKYFLIMPALYSFLERMPIKDARDARATVREYEIGLTHRLKEGSCADDARGIIGSGQKGTGNQYVKYDPAYIYQVGLETYGLVRTKGNLYGLLAERSRAFSNMPERHYVEDEIESDSHESPGARQLFLCCGENYNFGSKDPMSIALTYKEASFLRRQIIKHTSGTFLGYLLESELYQHVTRFDFEALGDALVGNVPENLYHTYLLARRFSRFANILRLRYALLYDIAVGAEKAKEEEISFAELFATYKEEFTPDAIGEIIRFISSSVTEETCKNFCQKAARMLTDGDLEGLDRLIVDREVEIKTLKRSKLKNAKEFEPGKPFETPKPMSFRWNGIVRNVLREIKEGLDNE